MRFELSPYEVFLLGEAEKAKRKAQSAERKTQSVEPTHEHSILLDIHPCGGCPAGIPFDPENCFCLDGIGEK